MRVIRDLEIEESLSELSELGEWDVLRTILIGSASRNSDTLTSRHPLRLSL